MARAYRAYPNNFVMAYYVSGSSISGTLLHRGDTMNYWTSTEAYDLTAYQMQVNLSVLTHPGTINDGNKYNGMTI